MQPPTDHTPARRLLIALAIGMLIIGFSLGLMLKKTPDSRTPSTPVALASGTLIPNPRPLAPFKLTDHTGREFSQESIKGSWQLFSFGYTHCPDICPTTLAMLAQLADRMQRESLNANINTVFITIDPERDTQAVLARYVPYFNNRFLGVTGERQALDRLTRQLGILYARVETEKSSMGYLMDHSTSIILTNPAGEFQALFSAPHDVEAMAQDLLRLINQGN